MTALQVYAILNKKIRSLISGIKSIIVNGTTIIFEMNDGTKVPMIFPTPEDGVGISEINKIETQGLVDTYRIILTDGSHFDFHVTNGKDGTGSDGNRDAFLEKDIISNVTIGGADSGTKFFQGQTFTEFVEIISRKDITPTISVNFTNTGIKEIGTTVNGTTITLSISNLSDVTVSIDEIRFYINNTLIDKQLFDIGKANYIATYSSDISTNTTIKAELIYNKNQKVSKQESIAFVYASYYGLSNLPTITDMDASNYTIMFNKSIKTTKNFTWDNIISQDERFLYMYPQSFGTLTSIKDGNGFNQMDSYTRFDVNIASPVNGNIIPYYAYMLTDATTGSGFCQIYE